MFVQMSFLDMLNATSSQALASGPLPSAAPGGRMIGRSGPDPAHASLSARQAKDAGLLMSGTFGLPGNGSSSSAGLQRLLENRLRERTSILGSTLYKLTWKDWVTPLGVCRSRLRASVPRISEIVRTGWPTPTTGNATGSQMAKDASPTGRRPDGSKATVSLPQVASFAGWPTPMAGTPAQKGYNAAGNNDSSRKTVALATTEGPARLTVSGEMLTGSDAETRSGGQLSPAHSLWLMLGPFATAWASCGERVMRSRSAKRKNSPAS